MTSRLHDLSCCAGVVSRALGAIRTRTVQALDLVPLPVGPRGRSWERRIRTSTSWVRASDAAGYISSHRGRRGDGPPAGPSAGTARPRSVPPERAAGACAPRTGSGPPCAGCSRRRRPRCRARCWRRRASAAARGRPSRRSCRSSRSAGRHGPARPAATRAAAVPPAGHHVEDQAHDGGHRVHVDEPVGPGLVDLGDPAHEHPHRVAQADPVQRAEVGVEDKDVHADPPLGSSGPVKMWSGYRDSNPGPRRWQRRALPAELQPHGNNSRRPDPNR